MLCGKLLTTAALLWRVWVRGWYGELLSGNFFFVVCFFYFGVCVVFFVGFTMEFVVVAFWERVCGKFLLYDFFFCTSLWSLWVRGCSGDLHWLLRDAAFVQRVICLYNICVCLYIYVYIYIQTHTHTHTHTHTYKHAPFRSELSAVSYLLFF